MTKHSRSDIPCLHSYIDSDGFFCCESFNCLDSKKEEYRNRGEAVELCCENCVNNSKRECSSCENLISENDVSSPTNSGFCLCKQKYNSNHKLCENYSLRLFESKQDMLNYINYENEK